MWLKGYTYVDLNSIRKCKEMTHGMRGLQIKIGQN